MRVYADYAATGPVKKEVLTEIMPYLTDDFGNASSMHEWGRAARIAIDRARTRVAQFLGATEQEIIFTSGGTESDNLAIKGIISNFQFPISNQIINPNDQISKPHIITSQIEHHAVLRSCESLEKAGLAEVTYIKPNTDGIIDVPDIEKAIKDNTVLVSIMYVNNEIGTVQPIAEIGKLIKSINSKRLTENGQRIYFHTDAVQAAEYQNMFVDALHVDLLTLSGHKIGAPKGVGVLYIRKGVQIAPIIHGGEQEFNKRAGTENTAGIVGIGKAVELIQAQSRKQKAKSLLELQDYFIDRILKEIPETTLNGSREFRSPNNINIYFKYVEGESILMNLDLVGIAASSGSACTSLSLQPSHVIMAMCSDAEHAHGSIRLTISADTNKVEVDYMVDNLKEIIKKLRKMSPLAPREYK